MPLQIRLRQGVRRCPITSKSRVREGPRDCFCFSPCALALPLPERGEVDARSALGGGPSNSANRDDPTPTLPLSGGGRRACARRARVRYSAALRAATI